jgi:hypothetical protein
MKASDRGGSSKGLNFHHRGQCKTRCRGTANRDRLLSSLILSFSLQERQFAVLSHERAVRLEPLSRGAKSDQTFFETALQSLCLMTASRFEQRPLLALRIRNGDNHFVNLLFVLELKSAPFRSKVDNAGPALLR